MMCILRLFFLVNHFTSVLLLSSNLNKPKEFFFSCLLVMEVVLRDIHASDLLGLLSL